MFIYYYPPIVASLLSFILRKQFLRVPCMFSSGREATIGGIMTLKLIVEIQWCYLE